MSEVNGVRADLIARFKREIQDKTYKVKSEELADKITQKLREEETFAAMGKKYKLKGWTA